MLTTEAAASIHAEAEALYAQHAEAWGEGNAQPEKDRWHVLTDTLTADTDEVVDEWLDLASPAEIDKLEALLARYRQ